MRWWIPTRSALPALALSLVSCGRPLLPSARADACAGARAKVEMQRRELEAGRLLRVVAASGGEEARCPVESAALAALALQAAVSLGDAEAVARLGGVSPAPAPPIELFAPDGPVAGYSSAEELRAGYGRAVQEYLGKRWASAGKLGLASPGDGLFVVEPHTIEDTSSPTGHVGPFRQEVVRYDLATGRRSSSFLVERRYISPGPWRKGTGSSWPWEGTSCG